MHKLAVFGLASAFVMLVAAIITAALVVSGAGAALATAAAFCGLAAGICATWLLRGRQ